MILLKFNISFLAMHLMSQLFFCIPLDIVTELLWSDSMEI